MQPTEGKQHAQTHCYGARLTSTCLQYGSQNATTSPNPALPTNPMGQPPTASQGFPLSSNRRNYQLPPQQATELCALYNALPRWPRCPYNPCKFLHACKNCQLGHPAAHCPQLSRKRPPQCPPTTGRYPPLKRMAYKPAAHF